MNVDIELLNNKNMEASELRIGNYIFDNDRIRKWQATDYTWNMESIQPIELTSEILERWFVLRDRKYSLNSLYHIGGLLHYDLINKWIRQEGESVWPIIATRVKYLHQLQNLFYCLSGEELQIAFDKVEVR